MSDVDPIEPVDELTESLADDATEELVEESIDEAIVEAVEQTGEDTVIDRAPIDKAKLPQVIEAALMVAGRTLNVDDLAALFDEFERPTNDEILNALERISSECLVRGVELKEVATGYRFQGKQEFALYLARLWEEKPQKYTRATLETLALIAYRQPITRGEIEEIRGVSVSSQTVKSMMEREWIRVVGHRDVPGRPALYATTKQFLDYFNLKSLDELPTLAELKDFDNLNVELDFEDMRQSSQRAKTDSPELEKAVVRMEQQQALESAMEEAGIADVDSDVDSETGEIIPPESSLH